MSFGDHFVGPMSGQHNLILTRHEREAVAIDHKGERLVIWLTHVDNRGKVKIGFHGSRDFIITREELMASGTLLRGYDNG